MSHPKHAETAGNDSTATPNALAWCYFATFFVLGLTPAAVGPTLSVLAEQTGSQLHDISIVFSMRSLGYLCSARFIGGIYDRRRGHPVMAIAMSLAVVLLFTIPFISSLGMLSGIIFLLGIASSFIDLGGNILLIWAFNKNTGPYLNGLHFSFGLGAVAAPLLVTLTLTAGHSPTYAYWLIALVSIPMVAWISASPSPSNPKTGDLRSAPASRSNLPVWLLVSFFFLYGGSEVSFGGWIHTYGMQHNALSATSAAYLTSAFWGSFTFGRLLAIPLVKKFQIQWLMRVQLIGVIFFMALLLTVHANIYLTWTCTLMTGLCMSSLFPLAMAYFERFTGGSGKMTSWFFVGAGAGSMVVPWSIGQYFEHMGPSFFTGVVLVCIALAFLILFRINFIWTQASIS